MMLTMKISRPSRPVQLLGLFVLMLILAAGSPPPVRPSHALPTTENCLLTENRKLKTENCLLRDQGQPAQPPHNHMVQYLQHAIARVEPLLDQYGYAAVFLAVLVEGMGLVAPGQTLLIAAALTAARGHLNIAWVLILAFSAAALGNSLGYLIGRWGGRPLLHKIRVNEQHLQRLEGYFGRYGKGVVLMARFFDGLRQLNGIVAGMLRMPWSEFTLCSILGAALWTGAWGVGTYFLEKEIASVHFTFRQVEPWIAVLSLLAFLALMVYLLRSGRTTKS
jgi:membrane protein DedA with SNARE-associated domain